MAGQSEFTGEIVVASRIVDYLSSGLYKSPAACLKELINNSFDADATRVDMFVKPDADRIIIEDNGSGMDKADFIKHFSKISESYKRDGSDHTPTGRPKIGKIGIGFIAANEICDIMEIISSKEGSEELLEVSISFDLMRLGPEARRRKDTDIAKGDYRGKVSKTDRDSHFTQVFLKSVRGEARAILEGAGTTKYASGKESLYGLSVDSVYERLRDSSIRTWSHFDSYSENMLEVGLNVPVRYYDDWMPVLLRQNVMDIKERIAGLNFALFIDGTEVRKPIVFRYGEDSFVSSFEFNGKYVSAGGYFFAQHTAIWPQELQGLLIRIRNAAVGEHDPTFLGYSSSLSPLLQKWISGEIVADDKLEDAMNIDRRTLRVAHPAFVELQQAVHEHLTGLLKRVRNEIYGTGSQRRKAERALDVEKKILRVANREVVKIAPKAAKHLQQTWAKATYNPEGQKNLLRKYTVDQLYEIVIRVAEDILSPEQLDEFITRLTDRLQQ